MTDSSSHAGPVHGWAVYQLTDDKIDLCVLGDCRLVVARVRDGGLVYDSNAVRGSASGAWAYSAHAAAKTLQSVEHVMSEAIYGRVEGLRPDDLVIVFTGGIAKYIGDAAILLKCEMAMRTPDGVKAVSKDLLGLAAQHHLHTCGGTWQPCPMSVVSAQVMPAGNIAAR